MIYKAEKIREKRAVILYEHASFAIWSAILLPTMPLYDGTHCNTTSIPWTDKKYI